MEFIHISSEQTTAVTDLLLGVLAIFCAGSLQRYRQTDPLKVGIWTWTFAFLALAATLGSIAHGFVMTSQVADLIWQPLNLSLGLGVALYCVGAIHDAWGRAVSRRVLLPMVCLGGAFYAVTLVIQEGFVVFVVYQVLGMSVAFFAYLQAAYHRRIRGAGVMVAAVLVNIIAAAIQAKGSVSFRLVWEFDHNGLFHLVQMIGVVLLCTGLHLSLQTEGELASAES
jgi:hypothetical protein